MDLITEKIFRGAEFEVFMQDSIVTEINDLLAIMVLSFAYGFTYFINFRIQRLDLSD